MMLVQITTLIIFVLLPIVLCILRKHRKTPDYEVYVMSGTNDVIVSTLIGFIGICFTVFSLFANRSIGASIGLYVFGLLFGIFAMLGFFSTLLDLTVFKDNKIIVKRLFVTKEIPLTQIQRINCFKGNIHFFTISKNNKYKTLFTIDASAKNATEFVRIIDKKLRG